MAVDEPDPGTARARILTAAWEMVGSGRLSALTMAAAGRAAGVSRQTVYVQFGTRAGLLVQMVRERDADNPRAERVAAALEAPDPGDALAGLSRELAGWWPELHPVAQALYAAALTDAAARAAWDDRMAHLRAFSDRVVDRLAEAGQLAAGWEPARASEWLAAQLNPVGWHVLVVEAGWTQALYEERLATTVRQALLAI